MVSQTKPLTFHFSSHILTPFYILYLDNKKENLIFTKKYDNEK